MVAFLNFPLLYAGREHYITSTTSNRANLISIFSDGGQFC